jgi:monoterpene epsilon-lactone hydrolase
MESDMSVPIIKHDLTAADAEAMEGMRAMFATMPKLRFGPESRGVFDDIMSRTPAPDDVQFEPGDVGGVPGWWCRPKQAQKGGVILYLHGGGYVLGSAKAYRNLAGHIAKLAGVAAFVADYALAPERPFPAAFDDFHALHEGLLRLGYERIAVVGDSAGGGLALASVTGGVAKSGRIVGVVAMSPWVDTTLSGDSMNTRAAQDPLLSRETIEGTRALFLGEHGGDRRLDILGADLSTMPPIRIDVGDAEVLLDDAVRFAQRADRAGVTGEVHVWDGMVHVFPSNIAMLEASAAALKGIGEFLVRVLRPSAP